MALQINMLEEAVQRLHIRLQRAVRALYVLHNNGNEEAAAVALERVELINTKIAELHALLDIYDVRDRETTVVPVLEENEPLVSYAGEPGGARFVQYEKDPIPQWAVDVQPEPSVATEEVVIDDPDQDDLDMEYRGTLIATILIIIVVALGTLFGSKIWNLGSNIADKAAPAVVEEALVEPALPIPDPVVVNEADISTVTYTVQKGDTLWSIAAEMLGDSLEWGAVYGQNVNVIGDDPNLIFPGQVLTITKVSVGSTTIG